MTGACCTCAVLLSQVIPTYDSKSEKPVAHDRQLDCCGRVICGKCIEHNPRFSSYCPFCQISDTPSALPQGLRDPPAYSSSVPSDSSSADLPPAYASIDSNAVSLSSARVDSKQLPLEPDGPVQDVLHFVDPDDTLSRISLRYKVPVAVLKSKNNLFADHLLLARRTILIPGTHYKGGVSLSPRPPEGEEEEARKQKIRKWMVACKCADYDVALLYLDQAGYDLDKATERWKEEERWEKDHPMEQRGPRSKLHRTSRFI